MVFHRPVVLIVGAGVGGLTTALALRRAGFSAFVVDNQRVLSQGKRVGVPLWSHALRVLDRLGVGVQLRMLALPTLKCEILSVGKNQNAKHRTLASISLSEYSQNTTAEALVVDRAELQHSLLEALPPNTVWTDCRFVSMQAVGESLSPNERNTVSSDDSPPLRVKLMFGDGNERELDCALVIGADGKRSLVRGYINHRAVWRSAGFTQWQGVVDIDPQLHGPTSTFPMFTAREFWGAGDRFGFMTMSPGRVYWYATCNTRKGQVFLRPFKKHLESRFGGFPVVCSQLLQACVENEIERNDAYVLDRAMDVSLPVIGERIALVGNAGYPATSNFHQQTCMAIEDAFTLAQCIGKFGLKDSLALEMYNAARMKRSRLIAKFGAQQLSTIAQWERPWLVKTRNSLLTLAATHSLLRNQLTRLGVYEAGSLPLSRPYSFAF
uniref:FAD-binding domain-containing protein n=1 Tax=Timspurckia oligopyrenoides TaxID=708627 RepID=A0A7S1ET96_9RHOD|mmetsp:Transcript_6221/g.11096  ORF Transcript_6221/g.11096 Transcript_6221/m.11096 type:complete len:438 (+) Transcript_6221:49-1362(+)